MGKLTPLVNCCLNPDGAIRAKYCMTFLVFSVFPAPDSPLGKKEMWEVGYQ